jgi:hypothetical protein
MHKKLCLAIATVAVLSAGLFVPPAADAKSRAAVHHRSAASQSTITSFSSSSAPLNVGVNHPAKK